MSDESTWMQIAVLIMSAIGLVAACCTPCMTALANVIMFAGFRMIRDYLSPPSSSGSISADSTLVCHFRPPDHSV